MCSYPFSVPERWGTHRWGPLNISVRDLCCLLKPPYWSRELQSPAQLEKSMEEILQESQDYRGSCWHLESSVTSSVILQSRGWFVITGKSWWEGSSGGRLAWSAWKVLGELFGSLVTVHIMRTQCKSLRETISLLSFYGCLTHFSLSNNKYSSESHL